MDAKNYVIVTKAPEMDYKNDYVALPRNYGTPAYYSRPDVSAIRQTVFRNLEELDEKTGFTEKMKNRKVLIKPNFVGVYHKMGFRDDDYPQSTDPRVIDAVVDFVKRHTGDITIIEGSGAPVTRLMAKINGTDRIVKKYGIRFEAVEELPVDKYLLPQAQVMKEVYIPRTFSQVVRGEAFYISLPKMKTNLYTGVTLGFKNAMGSLSTHMRYRNHNYNIDKKLVDLLYLFKPDLTVIDGIIGAEGDVPAPVDPVEAGLIISGTNSVETDRVATRIMSHDPAQIRLMREADKLGFGDPHVEVIGEVDPIPWRRADTSIISGHVAENFPHIRFLVGAAKNSAPRLSSLKEVTLEKIQAMEQACPGGCLPSLIMAFENYRYMKNYSPDKYKNLTVLLGAGAEIEGSLYYFDKHGKSYTREEILALPGRKVAAGSCTSWMKDQTDYYVEGCTAHVLKLANAIDKATGTKNPMLKKVITNPAYMASLLKSMWNRYRMVRAGNPVDIELSLEDRIFEGRKLSEEEQKKNFIPCGMPPMTKEQKKQPGRHPGPLGDPDGTDPGLGLVVPPGGAFSDAPG
jgi:uncharacterized protein (DUF362 family)